MLESIDACAGRALLVWDSGLMWSRANPGAENRDVVLEAVSNVYNSP